MKAFFIQWVSVFLCLGTFGTPVFASLPVQPGSSDLQTAGGNASLEDIPLAGRYAISSVIGNDRERYHGVVDGTGIVMENTVHQYSAGFDDQGVALHFGDQRLLMTLKAYGYGDVLQGVQAALPVRNKNKITYRRGPIEEWYVNGPYGLQQGFTLDDRPVGPSEQQGKLTMLLALDSGLLTAIDPDGRGMELTTPDGRPVLRYSGLIAVDADGNQCPARLELQAGNLAILIDDTAARYPLTIDPVFQAAKLTSNDAPDPVTDIFFGSAVAISGDTMVVGAPRYDTNGKESGGAAYLFIRQAAGYAEWGRYFQLKMYSSPGDNFGRAVAVSSDTVVVGSPNHGDQGTAYVFVKSGTEWTSMFPAATLTAGDGAAGDNFGTSVAVAGDIILVGADKHDVSSKNDQGVAYVFIRPGSGWVDATETTELTAGDGAAGDNFGGSVALNGSFAVVGAYQFDSNGPGAAYVFQGSAPVWPNTTWLWTQHKLTASDGGLGDQLGKSVAISGDTVVVGAPNSGGTGAAYIFIKPGTVWEDTTQTGKLENTGSATGDLFGVSVAVNGNTVVVGDWKHATGGNQFQGTAFTFVKPALGWAIYMNIPTVTLVPGDGAAGDRFGSVVAIDGSTAVVGAYSQGSGDQGAAYSFEMPAAGWSGAIGQSAKIGAVGTDLSPQFGVSIGISGDTVIVGAPMRTPGGNVYQGAAYIFVKDGTGWSDMSQRVKLLAGDGAAGDQFGFSVAVSGNTAVVGAPYHKVGTTDRAGTVYVFVRPDVGWGSGGTEMYQSAKLTASDRTVGDHLGISVAISEGTVVAGAPDASGRAADDEGAAYVFEQPAQGWSIDMNQTAKLYAGDGRPLDSFGQSVGISGDTVVVGAPDYDVGADQLQNQGAAYVFVKSAADWPATHTAQLLADDGSKDDAFGKAVAVSGETVVVGAPYYAIGTNQNQGTVYVYTKPTGGWSGVLNQNCRLFADNAVQGDSGFGSAVATNGNIIVTGMPFTQGDLYLFGTKTTDWTTVSGSLSQSDILQGKDSPYALGHSVALSGDTLVSGTLAESVYLFTNVGQTFPWTMFLPAITIRRN